MAEAGPSGEPIEDEDAESDHSDSEVSVFDMHSEISPSPRKRASRW